MIADAAGSAREVWPHVEDEGRTSSRSVQNIAKKTHNARARVLPDASVSAKTIVMTLKLTRHSAMNE